MSLSSFEGGGSTSKMEVRVGDGPLPRGAGTSHQHLPVQVSVGLSLASHLSSHCFLCLTMAQIFLPLSLPAQLILHILSPV